MEEIYPHEVDTVRLIMSLPNNTIKFEKTIGIFDEKRIEYIDSTPQMVFNRDCTFINNDVSPDENDIIGFDKLQIFWKDYHSNIVVKDFPYKPLFKTKFNKIDPIIDVYTGVGVWKEGYVCWIPETTTYCNGLFEKAVYTSKKDDPIITKCPNGKPYMLFTRYKDTMFWMYNYTDIKSLYRSPRGSDFKIPKQLTNLIYFSDIHEKIVEWQREQRKK
jgi:hypothetical protein